MDDTTLIAIVVLVQQRNLAVCMARLPPPIFPTWLPPIDPTLFLLLDNPSVPRPLRGPRPDIRAMDDATAQFRFRFTVSELDSLVTALSLPATIRVERRSISSVLALAMLLRRLTWPSRLGDLVSEFGYDYTSLSLIINHMCTTLAARFSDHLQLWSGLTQQQVRTYERAVTQHTPGVRCIWASLDGTFRPIAKPIQQQRASYSGYKRRHGQHYQAVVAPDGIVVSLSGPWAGSRNDLGVFHESQLDMLMRPLVVHGNDVYHMFGDKAYQSLDLVMCPFHPPLNDTEQEYNKTLSALRVSVEHFFGKVTKLWSFTDVKRVHRTGLQPTAAYYKCMTLFTNLHTCMSGGNQVSEAFDMNPPTVAAYIANA